MTSTASKRRDIEARALSEFPLIDGWVGSTSFPDESSLDRLRLQRLRSAVARAGRIPFYRDLWRGIDLDPREIGSVSDLASLPAFDVEDVRLSLDQEPPFGRHHDLRDGFARVQFSGGTTGTPRPVAYTYWDRVLGEIMHARCLAMHGTDARDVVVNSMAYGPHNAAIAFDGALHRYVGAAVLPLSTGHVTSSVKQVSMLAKYGVTQVVASADYLVHLGRVAVAGGYDLRTDFSLERFTTIGDVAPLEAMWDLPAFSCYGTFELQMCATECQARDGWHLWEDAYVTWLRDPISEQRVPVGQRGELIVTSLWSEAFPIINLNTRDVSSVRERNECPCGVWFEKMDGFLGRSDSMVKVRGINVWPEAVGTVLADAAGQHVEYLCVVTQQDGRDDLTVFGEFPAGTSELDVKGHLKEKLGVLIRVEPVAHGGLARVTRRDTAAKTVRFIDRRSTTTDELSVDSGGAPIL